MESKFIADIADDSNDLIVTEGSSAVGRIAYYRTWEKINRYAKYF